MVRAVSCQLMKENERELQDLEKERIHLQIETRLIVQRVFEVCGRTPCNLNEFDWEGDDDILKLNFAGNPIDIRRGILAKPQFGRNLFSCLFQKKWDEFHVRDNTGRIYVDWKGEWLTPLLDYMKSNHVESVATTDLLASNYFLIQIMRFFKMNHIFEVQSNKASLPIVGLDNPKIHTSDNLQEYVREKYLLFDPSCLRADFKSVYKHNSKGESRPLEDYDIRFKFFLFVMDANGKTKVGYTRPRRIQSIDGGSSLPGKSRPFEDLFPIEASRLSAPLQYGYGYKRLEIYEVRSNYENIQVTEIRLKEKKPTDSKEEDNTRSNAQKLLSSINNYEQELILEKVKVEDEIKFLEGEVLFMTKYFYLAWNLDLEIEDTAPNLLNLVVERKRTFDDHIQNKKRKRTTEESVSRDSLFPHPIVSFNVEEEIFTILRSTILRVIPKSQLAVRVSGRWEEQAEKGDIDEVGNLVVNCHKESFRQIIAALQVYSAGKLRIFVTALCRDFIEETLDCLLIAPCSLVYVD
jgi:hypothetical protein